MAPCSLVNGVSYIAIKLNKQIAAQIKININQR